MKTRVVKRIRVVNYLSKHNIYPVYHRADYDNPKYKVFIYERTDELENLINQYYEEAKLNGTLK